MPLNAIALEYPAEATQENYRTFINNITAADPALLVLATAGNAVTVEESYAETNNAVPTAGSVAAEVAARTLFVAQLNALLTALAGNPLGEGVEGTQLAAIVKAVNAANGMSTNGVWVRTGNPPPAGLSEVSQLNYEAVTLGLGDFIALLLGALQLQRSRTILAPAFAANGK